MKDLIPVKKTWNLPDTSYSGYDAAGVNADEPYSSI